MLPFTLDNHFTFGYGDGLFNPLHKSPENRLWCKYSRASRQPGTFREECVRTAVILSDQAKALGRKPIVCLSGGMDSEVVVKSFLEANVEFDVLTFRLTPQLNFHELRYSQEFCRQHKLKPLYLDIDIRNWIQSEEAAALFQHSQAASFNLVPHMKMLNHIWFELRGMPIMGNGDVYLDRESGNWNYVELEYMLAWFRHCIQMGILGGIGFFQHTPEIVLAMLREPKIEVLGTNQDPYATKLYTTSKFIKYAIYKKHWPDLKHRAKLGGHELVAVSYKKRTLELLEYRADQFIDRFEMPYTELRSALEPVSTPEPTVGTE